MVSTGGPISRGAAQQLARTELAKPIYHPHESFLAWLANELSRLFSAVNGAAPGGWWSVVALAAVAVLVIAGIFVRLGPLARGGRRPDSGLLGTATSLSALEHRNLAERYAAAGDQSGAILEFLRAIAAEVEERAVLTPGPGRTAAEFAAEAGRRLPDQAVELAAAATLFDEVFYGDRAGTAEGVERLRALDGAVGTALRRKPSHAGLAS
jgi:Domain of unknown function (DUF4129)